jgi:HD-like signal output (HDOD) protein
MPGMNGAELLNEVMRLYPQTARFIFSGQTEADLITRCVGTTHQCLAKPCNTEVLKSAIERTAPLSNVLENDALLKLLGGIQTLPAVPELYTKVTQALQDPETPLKEIGRIIEQDPAMTAQLLKLVNSAFFGSRRSIANCSEAVLYLGLETTKTLVLCSGLFAGFTQPNIAEFSAALWHHSLKIARTAKAFSMEARASGMTSDEAFAAGLLHDIGRLILLAHVPAYKDALMLVDSKQLPLLQAETEAIGVTHADAGAYLMSLWGLPFTIVEAVAFHHCPANSNFEHFAALTAIHAAECLCADTSLTPEDTGAQPDPVYLRRVGCEPFLETWRDLAKADLA